MRARGLRTALTTRRGVTILARDALTTFGVLGGCLQIYDVLTPGATYHPLMVIGLLAFVPLAVGLARAWPRTTVTRSFGHPDVTVTITTGDLFDQDTNLVIGYTTTFDTDVSDSRVIHPSSVQAQFQRRHHPDTDALDVELDRALGTVDRTPIAGKTTGKPWRYPVGTIAVLRGDRLHFCVAYADMGPDLVARATVDDIWTSLSSLWDTVYRHGQREPLSIAVIGSELAKVDSLDRASLIRLITLSFLARSRTSVVSRALTIVVHPSDAHKVDMLELSAFLSTI